MCILKRSRSNSETTLKRLRSHSLRYSSSVQATSIVQPPKPMSSSPLFGLLVRFVCSVCSARFVASSWLEWFSIENHLLSAGDRLTGLPHSTCQTLSTSSTSLSRMPMHSLWGLSLWVSQWIFRMPNGLLIFHSVSQVLSAPRHRTRHNASITLAAHSASLEALCQCLGQIIMDMEGYGLFELWSWKLWTSEMWTWNVWTWELWTRQTLVIAVAQATVGSIALSGYNWALHCIITCILYIV